MLPTVKRDQMAIFSKPRDISASALCAWYPVPGLYSPSSECLFDTGGCRAVSILYPWASPQQWPTWESRPGGGINQLPPSLGGLLPAHHATALGRALLGWFPLRACWNSQRWELCVLKSLQRGYILLGNLTWWPPETILREETSNWASVGWKKLVESMIFGYH